ncbi:hypothetical protein Zmor_008643 [Zophobas morio]|uniref:Uncharacterized protein n=1 Tax=Zophobas morio TaxID=2755281 RepID=A0AA38HKB0_9CUCU|nr:hypothetical protein Zmor_008643 [Zophobas morio]
MLYPANNEPPHSCSNKIPQSLLAVRRRHAPITKGLLPFFYCTYSSLKLFFPFSFQGNQLKEEYCEASKCMSRNWQELQDYSEKHLVKNIKIFIAQQLQLEGGKLSYLQKALEEVALNSAASREFNKARDKN